MHNDFKILLIVLGIISIIIFAIYLYGKWEAKHATTYHERKNKKK